jgi:hypothetical protein
MALAFSLTNNLDVLGNVALPQDDSPDATCVGKVLKIRVEPQNQNNWCWASVGAAVARAFEDPDPAEGTLCGVASRVCGLVCCPSGVIGSVHSCDAPDELERFDISGVNKGALGKHLNTTPIPGTVDKTFALVKDLIDNGIPIAVKVAHPKTVGHFVVISGYCVMQNTQYIFVGEPRTGQRVRVDFTGFLTRYQGDGVWDHTYVTQGLPPLNGQPQGLQKVPEEV